MVHDVGNCQYLPTSVYVHRWRPQRCGSPLGGSAAECAPCPRRMASKKTKLRAAHRHMPAAACEVPTIDSLRGPKCGPCLGQNCDRCLPRQRGGDCVQFETNGCYLFVLLYGKEPVLVDGKLDFKAVGASSNLYNRVGHGTLVTADARTMATEMLRACGYCDVLGKSCTMLGNLRRRGELCV